MTVARIFFFLIKKFNFLSFLASKPWKMQKCKKLFLITGQVHIYLQKRPRPLRFEKKAAVPPTSTDNSFLLSARDGRSHIFRAIS